MEKAQYQMTILLLLLTNDGEQLVAGPSTIGCQSKPFTASQY